MHSRSRVLRAASVLAVTVSACGVISLEPAAAQGDSNTWFVEAGAGPGGTGSIDAPFDSLAAVAASAGEGDTIVVQPAGANVPPLDGGIVLKPGQRLIGGGPAVQGAAPGADLPRLTNATTAGNGDAVVLARGSEVRNLVITGALRGGIYGSDAADAVVDGNDVAATNQRCADGFLIGPFTLPPTIAIGATAPPLPDFITLNNGWAAIMTDFSTVTGDVRIENNTVHDTACGDGIDVRATGTSRMTAHVTGNALRNINLGLAKLSVLAIGVQSAGTAELTAALDGNSQTDIAAPAVSPLNALADSEGLFINPLGQSRLRVTVTGNRFRNGGGHFSANGLEYVTTSGTPDSEVAVTDSDFDTVTGDIIENYNLSSEGARQSLSLDRVRAHNSLFPGAALNSIVPTNLGTCLVTTNFGRTGQTHLSVANSDFSDCSADGIGLIAFTPEGPTPSTAALTFDIHDTSVTGSAANGINIVNVGDTAVLQGTVARTTVTTAQQALLRANNRDGVIGTAAIDFGGGAQGSPGMNCLVGSTTQVDVSGLSLAAENNWWGFPGGPDRPQNAADTGNPLPTAPRPGC
ncbi:MAG: hypothetical protein JWN03_1533 [Nocardia sp.]|uniref:hypothetical protein n=1 Tax=Nocardia sp. TaxID=1821 RepID=UPI00261EA082|nr:hypothetical protein [Nocardia sp.]MCU1641258.1 hypothetical protein [Nocardia sp.]